MRDGPVVLVKVILHPNGDLQIELRHGAGHALEAGAKQWGMVLADMIRHISYSYQQTDGMDTEVVRAKVMDYLREDLEGLDPDHTRPSYRRFDSPGG
jgi:hypothetical protein